MPERTCRMRSAPCPAGGRTGLAPGLRFRYLRVGGNLATSGRLLTRLVVDGLHLDSPFLRDAPGRGEPPQRVERRPDHVVRVGGAEALREDVAHAGALEHRAYRAARDHAGPRRRGLEQYAARAVIADDLVRDGPTRERHLHHLAARGLDGLAYRLALLVRLPGRDADPALAVADGDERVEAEPPAALDDLGDAVDRNDVLDEAVAFALALAAVAPLATPPTPAPPPPPPPRAPCPPCPPCPAPPPPPGPPTRGRSSAGASPPACAGSGSGVPAAPESGAPGACCSFAIRAPIRLCARHRPPP